MIEERIESTQDLLSIKPTVATFMGIDKGSKAVLERQMISYPLFQKRGIMELIKKKIPITEIKGCTSKISWKTKADADNALRIDIQNGKVKAKEQTIYFCGFCFEYHRSKKTTVDRIESGDKILIHATDEDVELSKSSVIIDTGKEYYYIIVNIYLNLKSTNAKEIFSFLESKEAVIVGKRLPGTKQYTDRNGLPIFLKEYPRMLDRRIKLMTWNISRWKQNIGRWFAPDKITEEILLTEPVTTIPEICIPVAEEVPELLTQEWSKEFDYTELPIEVINPLPITNKYENNKYEDILQEVLRLFESNRSRDYIHGWLMATFEKI